MLTFQQWRCGELTFRDPSAPHTSETGISTLFQGPSGRKIVREAFWDGGDTFRVRFAPTETGEWSWAATGLSTGVEEGKLLCVPYEGDAELYHHGFLKVGPGGRYLCHADNTPFFWLGDTHWDLAVAERWSESNDPRFESQFRAIVDRRAQQRFNVYQCCFHCEADPARDKYFTREGGDLIPNLDFLQKDLDPKMGYLANLGFCIAAGFSWHRAALEAGAMEYYRRAVRYVIARYGAYPMIWTQAGEVGGYDSGTREALIAFWREIALETERLDSYGHLQTAHYTNERPFAEYYQDEDWFDFTLNQAGHGDYPIDIRPYRTHMTAHDGKPFVEGESMYEQILTLEPNGRRRCTPVMLRRVAYTAIQAGACGYTYGCQGMWRLQWDEPDPGADEGLGFGSFPPWYRGIDFPGAWQMRIMRDFYESVGWADLRPLPERCCSISAGGAYVVTFRGTDLQALFTPAVTADAQMRTVVAYFAENNRYGTTFRTLVQPRYTASWFDPASGEYTPLEENIVPENGIWTAPPKPSSRDMILVLRAC